MKDTATWSPSATWVTLVPTSVTMPEPSCPPTTGNIDFTPIISSTSGVWLMSPVRRCSSEWHMPDQTIFTRTSRLPGGSISISSVFQGSLSPVHTAARVVVIGNPSLRLQRTSSHPQYRPPPGWGQPGPAVQVAAVCPRAPAVFADMAARVRNWGRWGPDDEIGTLNLIDDAARRRGAAAVVSGRAFALGLPLSEAEGIQLGLRRGPRQPDPHHGPGERAGQRRPTRLGLLQRGRPHPGHPVRHPLGRARPRSYGGVIYNGYPASTVSADGAARCGIHRLGTVVSRGVLLDVARALGRDVLEPGHPIMPATSTRRASWPGHPRAGRHRAGAHGPDGASRARSSATSSPTPGRHPGSRSRRPSGSTPTTWPRSPPTRCPSRSSPASTRTPTSPSTCCTWWRWA